MTELTKEDLAAEAELNAEMKALEEAEAAELAELEADAAGQLETLAKESEEQSAEPEPEPEFDPDLVAELRKKYKVKDLRVIADENGVEHKGLGEEALIIELLRAGVEL